MLYREKKEQFIKEQKENLAESTKKDYLKKLNKLSQYERKHKTYIYDFTDQNLKEVLLEAFKNSRSSKSIDACFTPIKSYIEWAEKKGLRTNSGDSYIEVIEEAKEELITQSCINDVNRMVSREELYKLASNCISKQAALFALSLFEGLGGDEFKEIFSLTENSYTVGEQKLKLNDKLNDRAILVPLQLINIIDIAKDEEYLTPSKVKNTKFEKSDLIIKKCPQGKEASKKEELNKSLPTYRINYFNKMVNENFNTSVLKNAGICYYLSLIENIKGPLQEDDYKKVAKRYSFNTGNAIYQHKKLYEEYKKRGFDQDIIIIEELRNIYEEIMAYQIDDLDFNLNKRKSKQVKSSEERSDRENESDDDGDGAKGYSEPDPELGALGEDVIEKYLRWKFKGVTVNNETQNNIGYDLAVIMPNQTENLCVEVKSTRHVKKSTQFHITSHELEIANKQKNNYYLYIVYFTDNTPINLYIIENPIETLELKYYIENSLENKPKKDVSIMAKRFIVSINTDLLKSFEDEDFQYYIQKEVAKKS